MNPTDLLKEEYFNIQQQIETYDEKALTIKAWSVTVSITGIGAGFYESSPHLFWLSGASALLFWGIEVYWKFFQRAFYDRALEIENYFRGKQKNIDPLQISHSWSKAFAKNIRKPSTYALIFYPHIMLPHSIVFVGGTLLYFLMPIASK